MHIASIFPNSDYSCFLGQSLEKLYFGTLGSVSNLLGTATYTKATLMQALKEILIARAPINVRTLNYLSDYDSGDHSDHHSAARFIRDVVVSSYPSVTLSG